MDLLKNGMYLTIGILGLHLQAKFVKDSKKERNTALGKLQSKPKGQSLLQMKLQNRQIVSPLQT